MSSIKKQLQPQLVTDNLLAAGSTLTHGSCAMLTRTQTSTQKTASQLCTASHKDPN